MALTNKEKEYLRLQIKYYIATDYDKKIAVKELFLDGYKLSTINSYWRTFSESFDRSRKSD